MVSADVAVFKSKMPKSADNRNQNNVLSHVRIETLGQ